MSGLDWMRRMSGSDRRETGKPKLSRESIFPGANEAPLSYSRLKILSRETASAVSPVPRLPARSFSTPASARSFWCSLTSRDSSRFPRRRPFIYFSLSSFAPENIKYALVRQLWLSRSASVRSFSASSPILVLPHLTGFLPLSAAASIYLFYTRVM